jgi:hypothetical protein
LRAARSGQSYCFASIHRFSYTFQVMHMPAFKGATPNSTDLCRPAGTRRRHSVVLCLLLALGGCAAGGGWPGTQGEATPVAPPPSSDPLVIFASQAAPGSASSIVLADGRPATVRVARAYIAASGRECREVLVGSGTLQRAQLVCQSETGAWAQARPLLRGGGIVR